MGKPKCEILGEIIGKSCPSYDEIAHSIPMGFLFWKVNNLWQKTLNSLLHDHNLTHVQYMILATLRHIKSFDCEGVTQTQIAALTDSNKMMTSKVLRTLEKKGYVVRKDNKKDSRAKIVGLTKSGEKQISTLIPMVANLDKDFFETITKEKELKETIHNFYLAKSA